jgi:hypothetical protein
MTVTFVAGMAYYSGNITVPRMMAAVYAPGNNPPIDGVYANIFSFGTILGAIWVLGVVPHFGHEKWQMVAFVAFQTTMAGVMSIVGVGMARVAIPICMLLASTTAPISFLSFGMASLSGLEDQSEM